MSALKNHQKGVTQEARSLQMYKDMFSHAPFMMYLCKMNGEIVHASKQLLNKIGRSSEEVIGGKIKDFFTEASERKAVYLVEAFRQSGVLEAEEFQLISKDGGHVDVLLSAFVMSSMWKTTTSEENYVLGVMLDISDQKKLSLMYTSTKDDFQAIFQSSQQMLVLLDKDMNVITYNEKAAFHIHETTNKRVVQGVSFLTFVPERILKVFLSNFKKALKGESVRIQRMFNYDRHTPVWFELGYQPVVSENGEISRILFSALEITPFVETRQALLQSEIQFKEIFEQAHVGILISTLDGTPLKVNDTLSALTGYEQKELLQIKDSYFVHPHDLGRFQKLKESVQKGNKNSHSEEFRLIDSKGNTFWTYIHFSLILDEIAKPRHVVMVVHDISSLKKAQNELELRKSELNHFLYRSSHDLSGPVKTIAGINQLLKAKINDAELLSYLDMMNDQLVTMDGIAIRLNQAYIIKEHVLQPKLLSIQDFVKICVDLIRQIPDFYQVEYSESIPPLLELIPLDPVLLHIVLYNVLENALKFRDPAAQPSRIKLKAEKITPHLLQIDIEDNGSGIPETLLPHIFQMFSRSMDRKKGVGLGLYMVKSALDIMGGTIQVISTLHKGTLVRIQFPFD